jgi:hypothetical protein
MKKILLLITYLLFSGCTLTSLMARGSTNHKITILDQRTLSYEVRQKIPFSEISDLAYNPKTHQLYMIGDKGYLYAFRASFSQKIDQLDYLHGYNIKHHPDSEGLTFDKRGKLFISFEGSPRISEISQKGEILQNLKLPKKLRPKKSYKNSNSIFEALAYHPRYGLLTAAEHPINRGKNRLQTIYSLNGKVWHFMMEPYPNGAITAMEVMDDNNLLVIERAYNGLSKPFVVTLKKIYLNRCNSKDFCKSQLIASFSSAEGWGYNNFEGLTKVGKNRYIMVSDNNKRAIFPTLLLYFKVNP